ncbi:MAG: DUF1801 domain-containing protein [Pyrinomonadaceae bacterium]|nr:DUF1801 domain-containing protein [Pyrinomonadaceae bacterium]
MTNDIQDYNDKQTGGEKVICDRLAADISRVLPDAECKIWHAHPVWFINGNPIVGYSKQKAGIRLMFWSGASFDEDALAPGTGKFKDASVNYSVVDDIRSADLERWLAKSREIQWDYKNVVKRKGRLERLK